MGLDSVAACSHPLEHISSNLLLGLWACGRETRECGQPVGCAGDELETGTTAHGAVQGLSTRPAGLGPVLNFFQFQAYIRAKVPRVRCAACGKTPQVKVPWARPNSGFTQRMKALVVAVCRAMTVRQVAQLLGVSDMRLWRVLDHYVQVFDSDSMTFHVFLERLIRPFRKRRMEAFRQFVDGDARGSVLDVGGTLFNWQLVDYHGRVVLLNLDLPKSVQAPDNFEFVLGDGTALKYADREFDVVYSNSVIEHVGSFENQRCFASEARRVGRRIWVQTPAKSFFFEPHYLTPFVHYLPKQWQKRLLRNFSVWGWMVRPRQAYIEDFVDQTTLLGYKELRELFPDCEIVREKFLLMTKSFVVIRR